MSKQKAKLKPVKAWAVTYGNKLTNMLDDLDLHPTKAVAEVWRCQGEDVRRVEIREVEK